MQIGMCLSWVVEPLEAFLDLIMDINAVAVKTKASSVGDWQVVPTQRCRGRVVSLRAAFPPLSSWPVFLVGDGAQGQEQLFR
jgi:hypothetical protein